MRHHLQERYILFTLLALVLLALQLSGLKNANAKRRVF